jgi:hypothetical protein
MISMKQDRERERERERDNLEAFALIRGKNGDLEYLPFNCFSFLSLRASCRTYLTS